MSQHVAHRHSDEIHELRAEVERLTAWNAELQNECVEAADEIERLRVLLEAWHRIRGMPDRGQWIDEAGWQRAMDLYVETGRALEGNLVR